MKPVNEACLRNQEPICQVLEQHCAKPGKLLEIGSGTGQHAVYCARRLPHIRWQPSDLAHALPGIHAWVNEADLANLRDPLELDVRRDHWPVAENEFEMVFSANTLHFVGWSVVEAMLKGVARVLTGGGRFLAYGPFNRNGSYTSDGNAALDAWLKERDPDSGIKDENDICEHAARHGLVLKDRIDMPANNIILVLELA